MISAGGPPTFQSPRLMQGAPVPARSSGCLSLRQAGLRARLARCARPGRGVAAHAGGQQTLG